LDIHQIINFVIPEIGQTATNCFKARLGRFFFKPLVISDAHGETGQVFPAGRHEGKDFLPEMSPRKKLGILPHLVGDLDLLELGTLLQEVLEERGVRNWRLAGPAGREEQAGRDRRREGPKFLEVELDHVSIQQMETLLVGHVLFLGSMDR